MIDSGEMPLAPIWTARDDLRALLGSWIDQNDELGCLDALKRSVQSP